MPKDHTEINIDSGNGLVPPGNEPLLGPMLTQLSVVICRHQGAVSIRKTVLLGMVIPMLKIRRPTGRLIFNMGIPIPGKTVFYIETGPRPQ